MDDAATTLAHGFPFPHPLATNWTPDSNPNSSPYSNSRADLRTLFHHHHRHSRIPFDYESIHPSSSSTTTRYPDTHSPPHFSSSAAHAFGRNPPPFPRRGPEREFIPPFRRPPTRHPHPHPAIDADPNAPIPNDPSRRPWLLVYIVLGCITGCMIEGSRHLWARDGNNKEDGRLNLLPSSSSYLKSQKPADSASEDSSDSQQQQQQEDSSPSPLPWHQRQYANAYWSRPSCMKHSWGRRSNDDPYAFDEERKRLSKTGNLSSVTNPSSPVQTNHTLSLHNCLKDSRYRS